MDIEEYIEKIVDNGKIEDMQELSDMLEDTMEIIKDYDKECYKATAQDIVNKMRPYGMRWNIEETESLQKQRGIEDIPKADFFVVINSAYNDYKDIFGEDLEGYIRFTIDFIKDEDAKPNKVFNYFV